MDRLDPARLEGGSAVRSMAERDFLKRRLDRTRRRGPQPPAIPQARRGVPLPLSFAQQRMWFLQELAPGNPFYNIPAAVPLNGPIDQIALEHALNAIVERHETLRTVFRRIDGEPSQLIQPHRNMPLDTIDLSDRGETAGERQLNELATEEAETPFDLGAGRPIRFRLVRLAPERQVLLLTIHHIAADGWSMGVLFRELSELYEACTSGRGADLPALRVQYGDFAQWQRERICGASLDQLLGYWRQKLAGVQDLPLIADRPRPPVATFRGDFLDVSIDLRTTAAARKLAHENGCTLFQVMLAAYKAVLARFAGTDDVAVGAPIANRVHPELEPLIGFFVNSLVLRTDLSGDPTFREVLARVRQTTLDAYAHQDLPFERLVEDLQPERDLSRNPLFQVSFQIQNAPGITDQPVAADEDFRRIERSSAILDMAFSLWETQAGLIGGVEFSTDLFDRDSVRRIVDAVKLVVESAAADPDLPLSHLPLMDAGESRRFERLLHGAEAPVEPPTMDRMFAETASVHGARTALVDSRGELPFTALDELSGRVARAFLDAGIGPGDIVGLALPRDRDFVICMLAAVKLGAAYLPIDLDTPPGRLKAIAEAANPRIVIISDEAPAYPHGATGRVTDLLAFAASCEPLTGQPGPRREDCCYVLFTSGSTGRPKGIEIPHGALANHMQWMQRVFAVTAEDRVLQRTPAHFDASIWEFWLSLVTGGTLCMPPPFRAADTAALRDAIAELRPTILQCVPSLLPPLLAVGDMRSAGASIRLMCCGGEPLSAQLANALRQGFPQARIVNLYGPTEATIDATWHEVDPSSVLPPPIGRPIDNGWALVVDLHGQLCPPNMRGEIAIGGEPLARSYLGQSALTAQRFVELPANGRRSFLTGDMGWYDAAGELHCSGRKDRQVKLRGNRIELGEIEVVLEEHELVERAALITYEERGEPTLAAFMTLRDDAQSQALRREVEDEVVGDWKGLYRVVYGGEETAPADATDDFTGWTSSFTGQPISFDQMRRWAAETADRIRALAPGGVFEIGCGSGLILSRLAADCARYVGCDISAPVVERLRSWVERSGLGHVTVSVSQAQEAEAIDIAGCNTLVLNSVAQYLPSGGHLSGVLAANAARMPADARLFIGDLRPLGLLHAFHAAVEVARAPGTSTLGELRKRVETACAQEKELLFDPEFFRQLAYDEAALSGDVAVRLKNGADDNELFGYRYDVAIRCGAKLPPAPLTWKNWRRGEIDLERLQQAITRFAEPIAVAGIPNLRVARAVALSHMLIERDDHLSRAELVTETYALPSDGVDPGKIAAMAQAHGLIAELLPNRDQANRFDLVIHDDRLADYSIDAAQRVGGTHSTPLCNEPTLRALSGRLAPELRTFLAEQLPAAMLPSRFTLLERMPALTNGKLDYVSLARHVPHEPVRETHFEAPADALEQVIADAFAAVLGVNRVGASDDFFAALGGHSLLATQAVARLREIFGENLPLRLLFEHPTPADLARAMLNDIPDAGAVAAQYAAMRDLDEASLDALLVETMSTADE